ncbi:hypothetical protein HanIR_Chr16g0840521 [Helianthus annuus]|nr:hypothetical protein HanIR_Chr16g0840521 [Helianthus annuus]
MCIEVSIYKTYTLVYYYILFPRVGINLIYTLVYYSSTYVYMVGIYQTYTPVYYSIHSVYMSIYIRLIHLCITTYCFHYTFFHQTLI